jgi:hypothetical protein
LPVVAARPASMLRSEEFIPVIKSRRYNLLKLKEIYHMREKDRRLGRVVTESASLSSQLVADQVQRERRGHYDESRQLKIRPKNNSYLNLM